MKKVLMMILIVAMTITSLAFAKSYTIEVPDDIRVGLFYKSSAKNSFSLSSPGGIKIGTMNDGRFSYIDETEYNEEIIIKKSSKAGAVYIEGYGDIGSLHNYPYFMPIEKDGLSLMIIEGKKYRGCVEVRRLEESDMTVINHLTMQEYLYGVVPREIGGNSEIEAVKAQAIVARTYAAKNYNKRIKLGFNLLPSPEDQAYGGYEWETANSNKAVDETYGQVVVYNGELIGGYYFSTSGGYTENSENVWNSPVDYLKAVPDTYEPVIEGNTSWEVTMTASEVKASLKKYGIDVGEIVDLVPEVVSDTGRIIKLKIIGTNGEDTLTKSNARAYLGLKSQWYTINDAAPTVKTGEQPSLTNSSKNTVTKSIISTIKDGEEVVPGEEEPEVKEETGNPEWYLVVDEEKTESENIVIKPLLSSIINFFSNKLNTEKESNMISAPLIYKSSSNSTTFTFRGRGWGHAVGMSQNGAKGMAKAGFSAEEIIKWYYSGVEVY